MLQLLQEHKKGIGWIVTGIPCISLSMGMHRILLENGAKVGRQPQRQPKPLILDVMKNEIYIALEDKEKTTFTCLFTTFTHRRMFFDLGIKSEYSDKIFKFNGHYLKLFHERPALEKETIEKISFGKSIYSIIYLP